VGVAKATAGSEVGGGTGVTVSCGTQAEEIMMRSKMNSRGNVFFIGFSMQVKTMQGQRKFSKYSALVGFEGVA
jgi:hypothetical protein